MEQNRKIRKTKSALHKALLEILSYKNLEDITVTELCEKADINRSTFYNYYDIPADCFHEIAEQVINNMLEKIKKGEAKNVREFFQLYFDTACDNKVLFRAIHRTNIFNIYITRLIDEFSNSIIMQPNTDEVMTRFISYGFFGVTADWLEKRCDYTSDDIINIMEILDPILNTTNNSKTLDSQQNTNK